MINFIILEKEMKKINKEVDKMVKTENEDKRNKLPFKIKGKDVYSENKDGIDDLKSARFHARLIDKKFDNVLEPSAKKIAKKLKKENVDFSNIKINDISYYQTSTGIESFSFILSYSGVKCNTTVSFDNDDELVTSASIMKESTSIEPVKIEYGSADLGDMLPQIDAQDPVLNKEDLTGDNIENHQTSDVEENGDDDQPNITDDSEKDAFDANAQTEVIRNEIIHNTIDEVKAESVNTMPTDPVYSYMLFPALESPFDLKLYINESAGNNSVIRAYWDMMVLKKAIELHTKLSGVISDKYLYDLKTKLVLKEKEFNKLNSQIVGIDRGKIDFTIKNINDILNRKFKDADHYLSTKISEIKMKFNDTKKQNRAFRSIEKEYSSFIRKTLKDKIHLKKYIKNLKNIVESCITQYEDDKFNTILEKCAKNLSSIELNYCDSPIMESMVESNFEIMIENSTFEQYETATVSMMVILESMKEMMNNMNKNNNKDALLCLEKAYNSILSSIAEINIFCESVEDNLMEEAAQMEDEIRPIVEILNKKGYKVKYANPGHLNFKSKEDGKRDGLYYNKLYSDAHIQFDGNYGINAPKCWKFRTTETGDYLDVNEPTHTGSTDKEVITKKREAYKDEYMSSLRKWADALPVYNGDTNSVENEPPKNVTESFEFDDLFNDFL